MDDDGNGIAIAQEGIPVGRAADYQKVLDSRWRFMEVETEIPFSVVLPAQTNSGGVFTRVTVVAQHSLGFLPAFEAKYSAPEDDPHSSFLSIFSDTRTIFIRQTVIHGVNPAYTITGNLRIYNLPMLDDFSVPNEPISPTAGTVQNQGFRSLDGSVPNLQVDSQSPVGYSIDTFKKIISIHKTGLADINPYLRRGATVTAIDITTDILTLSDPGGFADSMASWITVAGTAMRYNPSDFTTYPGGLGPGAFYVIPVDATHIKLALSVPDAVAGIAIDITSIGAAMPNTLGGIAIPNGDEDKIFHNVGYPPTYLIASVIPVGNTYIIGPLLDLMTARVKATSTYLQFGGIQAVFGGRYGYIVLKDPAELVL